MSILVEACVLLENNELVSFYHCVQKGAEYRAYYSEIIRNPHIVYIKKNNDIVYNVLEVNKKLFLSAHNQQTRYFFVNLFNHVRLLKEYPGFKVGICNI